MKKEHYSDGKKMKAGILQRTEPSRGLIWSRSWELRLKFFGRSYFFGTAFPFMGWKTRKATHFLIFEGKFIRPSNLNLRIFWFVWYQKCLLVNKKKRSRDQKPTPESAEKKSMMKLTLDLILMQLIIPSKISWHH